MNRIVFLGSGGGRRMCSTQARKTGGLYVEFGLGGDPGRSETSSRFQNASHFENDAFSFAIDPGPGALVNAIAFDLKPDKWKGILVSHHHIDHVNDVNVIIDAIDTNMRKSKLYPFLVAEERCIRQSKKTDPYPYVTAYHQGLVKNMHVAKPGGKLKIAGLEIEMSKALHYAPNIGFAISCSGFKIGYPADGSYYPGQEKNYEDCDVLILNVPWPKGYDAPKNIHMTLDDAIALVRAIERKPKLVVISHLSFNMLRANMYKQERIFREATRVKCISADDFLEIDLDTLKTRILQPTRKIS
jgi:ribonuclease BN (tRNA processing enzyme)